MIAFLLLNFLLFIGSYLAGCIPIAFNFPAAKLRMLTIFGAGLLLGASLVIIIPEGVNSLYDTHFSEQHVHTKISQMKPAIEAGNVRARRDSGSQKQQESNAADSDEISGDVQRKNAANVNPLLFSFLTTHQHVGVALLLGYLCMLFVDQLGNRFLALPCCRCLLPSLISCSRRCCFKSTSSNCASSTTNCGKASNSTVSSTGHQRSTATLGLVIHSFADGLALGAAFASNQLHLEFILFLAIILHKVPAAFGLCCYLVHEGFSREVIRIHLLIFAAASPLAALLTYIGLTWSVVDPASSHASTQTGFALLLSGGTFLYVAASHILPEIIHTHAINEEKVTRTQSGDAQSSSDYTLYAMSSQDPLIISNKPSPGGLNDNQPAGFVPHLRLSDLLILTFGAAVPLLLSLGHSH